MPAPSKLTLSTIPPMDIRTIKVKGDNEGPETSRIAVHSLESLARRNQPFHREFLPVPHNPGKVTLNNRTFSLEYSPTLPYKYDGVNPIFKTITLENVPPLSAEYIIAYSRIVLKDKKRVGYSVRIEETSKNGKTKPERDNYHFSFLDMEQNPVIYNGVRFELDGEHDGTCRDRAATRPGECLCFLGDVVRQGAEVDAVQGLIADTAQIPALEEFDIDVM